VDVIVVGAGSIGLGCAWRAALAGAAVVVVDPSPERAASRVAAGMLAPAGEAAFGETALLRLNLASWRRWPAFVAELEAATGVSTGYWQCGSLFVARDADDRAALEREHRFRESLGLTVQLLSASECRALEPGLAPSVRGGMLAASDHQVDPRRLLDALRAACAAAGVRFVQGQAALCVHHGRATGVDVDGATALRAGAVVLAAGCWSAHVEGAPRDVLPPVRPVKGQVLRLRASAAQPLLSHVVRGVEHGYIVPRRGGEVVVGSTVEERGFDTSFTARAAYELLRDAHELVPDVLELDIVELCSGLRPGTPDNAPIVGQTALPGLIAATGHYRNGVLLTPVTADAVAAEVSGGEAPAEMAPFSPARFASPVGVGT